MRYAFALRCASVLIELAKYLVEQAKEDLEAGVPVDRSLVHRNQELEAQPLHDAERAESARVHMAPKGVGGPVVPRIEQGDGLDNQVMKVISYQRYAFSCGDPRGVWGQPGQP